MKATEQYSHLVRLRSVEESLVCTKAIEQYFYNVHALFIALYREALALMHSCL